MSTLQSRRVKDGRLNLEKFAQDPEEEVNADKTTKVYRPHFFLSSNLGHLLGITPKKKLLLL